MKGDIRYVLDYLNAHRIRATYSAVQGYLGFGVLEKADWRDVPGPPCQYSSWVINKKTGMPDGYNPSEMHPDLMVSEEIIGRSKLLLAAIEEFGGSPEVNQSTSAARKVEVADCHSNNTAVMCPNCNKADLISGFLNKGTRACPHCGKSKAVFADVKAEWGSIS